MLREPFLVLIFAQFKYIDIALHCSKTKNISPFQSFLQHRMQRICIL